MDKVGQLEREILRHRALYYQGRPEISDNKYDALEDQLKKLDPSNLALKAVGTKAKPSPKLKHETKMLSLDKTYKLDELYKWQGGEELVSMYKVDGSSCSLIYQKGKLFQGKTRGDGQYGEDIGEKVLWVQDIPKTITVENCEVRGEIYCSKEDFLALCRRNVQFGARKTK